MQRPKDAPNGPILVHDYNRTKIGRIRFWVYPYKNIFTISSFYQILYAWNSGKDLIVSPYYQVMLY